MTETGPEKRLIGYARVSTYGQTLDTQLEQLRAAGCSSRNIYREKVTGLSRDWGSCRDSCWRMRIVGGLEAPAGHIAPPAHPQSLNTPLTEGTANFLVNRRMAKSQQMRWSRRGADLLLQVRCAVYNGTLGT